MKKLETTRDQIVSQAQVIQDSNGNEMKGSVDRPHNNLRNRTARQSGWQVNVDRQHNSCYNKIAYQLGWYIYIGAFHRLGLIHGVFQLYKSQVS